MNKKYKFELSGCLLMVSLLILLLIFVQTDISRAEDNDLNKKNKQLKKINYKLNMFSIILDSYQCDPAEEYEIVRIPPNSSDDNVEILVLNEGNGEDNKALAYTRVYYIDDCFIYRSTVGCEFNNVNNYGYNQITDHNYHNIMGTFTIQMLTGDSNNVETGLNIIGYDSFIN